MPIFKINDDCLALLRKMELPRRPQHHYIDEAHRVAGADGENTHSVKGVQGYEFKTNADFRREQKSWLRERRQSALRLEDRSPRRRCEQAGPPEHHGLGIEAGGPTGRLAPAQGIRDTATNSSSSDQNIHHFMGRKFGSKVILIAVYVCFSFLNVRGRWGLLERHLVFLPGACRNDICGWSAWGGRTGRPLETPKSLEMLARGWGWLVRGAQLGG